MPKKGTNLKAEAARERRAAHKAEQGRQKAAQAEEQERKEWSKGAKDDSRRQREAEKKAAKQASKAEARALLQAEEKSLGVKPDSSSAKRRTEPTQPESFEARSIGDALELLDLASADPDSTKVSSMSGFLDRHPERRAKAAWKAFQDQNTPALRQEFPGLRLTQLHQILWKRWQKSPENPFNQESLRHNATAEEERAAASAARESRLEGFKKVG